MDDLIVILIRGIGAGAVLSLLAMSANVIFNSSGILNFAQGHLLVASGVFAYVMFPAGSSAGRWFLVLPLVVIAMVALTTLQGYLTLLPLKSSTEQHSWIITTLAASIVLGGAITQFMGPGALSVQNPFGTFAVYGTKIPFTYPALLLFAIVSYFALAYFQKKFLTGLALNALAQDLDAARALGAQTRRLQLLSFAIAGLILGVTGHLAAPVLSISESSGLQYATFGFIALVLGGLGNNLGALIAGPIFGVLQMFIVLEIGGKYQLPLALVVIVALLMLRPQGIFGRIHTRKV